MKTIGLIAGLGPESTLDYYRGIINAFKPTYDKSGYPEILIHSLDLRELLTLAQEDRWNDITELMTNSFERLRNAGADFGAMATNTPHKVFEVIQKRTALPLISIVRETAKVATQHQVYQVLLLGTRFTMQSDFYQQEFSKHEIQIMLPSEPQQEFIHDKIFSELEHGIINESTKQELLFFIKDARKRGADGVILGCTELPLILNQNDLPIVCLDTTQIHIRSIVAACQSD